MKFLDGEGRAVDAIRQKDWGGHRLGGPRFWSPALRSTLYSVLNSVSPKMLLWGPELFVFYNDACAELIDPVATPGLGEGYREFRADLWPSFRASIEGALAGRGSMVEEFTTVRLHDGSQVERTYQLFFSPVLDEDRKVAGVLLDALDVTARKRLEEHLRSEVALLNELFATTPVLIAYASGAELRLDYVNAAFERLLGARPLLGRPVSEAIPETAEDGYLDVLHQVLRSGEPWQGVEMPCTIRPPDGSPPRFLYLDFVYQPIASADGGISGILFSGYDVTERRKAREESERLRNALLHASHVSALGTMAVTIAHELNQPLTAAANYLSAAEHFAEEGAQPERLRPSLSSARGQLLRAGNIVRRMRSLVECGEARVSTIDLAHSIDCAIELASASGSLEGFAIDVEVAPDAREAMGDSVQIEQVLANLFRNAAQASQAAPERRAAVSTARSGEMVTITVRDQGPGIPGGRVESLFEALQEPSAGGLGVGLSLCRTIVEAHGGRITGRNDPQGGAVFSFTLPAVDEKAD